MMPIAAACARLKSNIPISFIAIAPSSVEKIPNCAAAPNNIVLGFARRGPKSVIAPIPINTKSGKIPVSKPMAENCASTPLPTAISTPGMLDKIPPNPIGIRSNGSNCLMIARYRRSNPIRIIIN